MVECAATSTNEDFVLHYFLSSPFCPAAHPTMVSLACFCWCSFCRRAWRAQSKRDHIYAVKCNTPNLGGQCFRGVTSFGCGTNTLIIHTYQHEAELQVAGTVSAPHASALFASRQRFSAQPSCATALQCYAWIFDREGDSVNFGDGDFAS